MSCHADTLVSRLRDRSRCTRKSAAGMLPLTATVLLGSLLGFAGASAWVRRPTDREMLRIRIVNDHRGEVCVSRDRGASWDALGRVVRYTAQVNRKGFTASKWVSAGQVAATAVNAIHINAGYNSQDDRGVVFSILPREFGLPPKGYSSFLSPTSSIYTDLSAGCGIFGGGEAPLVGSPVFVEGEGGTLSRLEDGYTPRRGDVLVIVVLRPTPYPVAALLENRPGGAVTLHYVDGTQRFLGWVIRPVRGVGRFAGSLYAGIGRIRANHAAVVDVSTSPPASVGAFQIIPVRHALSPEMHRAWERTQWMVVGPAADDCAPGDGLAPLFYRHVRPDYRADDLYRPDWAERLLARFLVDVDRGAGWEPMPALRLARDLTAPLPAWADNALADVERVRILFPVREAPTAADRRGSEREDCCEEDSPSGSAS